MCTDWDERVLKAAAEISVVDRFLTLESMNRLIEHLNDVNALVVWQEVMPEVVDADDLMVIAAEPEQFKEAVKAFIECMRNHLDAGICVGSELYAGRTM